MTPPPGWGTSESSAPLRISLEDGTPRSRPTARPKDKLALKAKAAKPPAPRPWRYAWRIAAATTALIALTLAGLHWAHASADGWLPVYLVGLVVLALALGLALGRTLPRSAKASGKRAKKKRASARTSRAPG